MGLRTGITVSEPSYALLRSEQSNERSPEGRQNRTPPPEMSVKEGWLTSRARDPASSAKRAGRSDGLCSAPGAFGTTRTRRRAGARRDRVYGSDSGGLERHRHEPDRHRQEALLRAATTERALFIHAANAGEEQEWLAAIGDTVASFKTFAPGCRTPRRRRPRRATRPRPRLRPRLRLRPHPRPLPRRRPRPPQRRHSPALPQPRRRRRSLQRNDVRGRRRLAPGRGSNNERALWNMDT